MSRIWQERLDHLKAVIEADIERGDYYGAVLKIGRGDVVVFEEAIGHAYADKRRPLKNDDVFSLFSVTKAFTNVLMMKAIEEGRLYGVVHDGEWFDVGTPVGLAEAEDYMSERFAGRRYR